MSLIRIILNNFLIFLTNLRRYKNLRNYKFNQFLNENPKNMDDDLLISNICFQAHHLDKIIKREYKHDLGKTRYLRIKLLMKEFNKRNLNEQAIKEWIYNILKNYNTYEKTKKRIILAPKNTYQNLNEASVIENILNRASVRFWQSKIPSDKELELIIQAGLNGPISCNRQAFKICIENNPTDKIILGNANNTSLLRKAPTKLFIAIDERIYKEVYACALDCGSFCANALLAAHSIGIEGCWIYVCESQDQNKLRKLFNLAQHYYFYSVLLLGYPREVPIKPSRRNIKGIIIKKDL